MTVFRSRYDADCSHRFGGAGRRRRRSRRDGAGRRGGLEEVLVTATRAGITNLQQTPVSVSAVTARRHRPHGRARHLRHCVVGAGLLGLAHHRIQRRVVRDARRRPHGHHRLPGLAGRRDHGRLRAAERADAVARHLRHRERRSPARPAGHAVRQEHDGRRGQHPQQAPGHGRDGRRRPPRLRQLQRRARAGLHRRAGHRRRARAAFRRRVLEVRRLLQARRQLRPDQHAEHLRRHLRAVQHPGCHGHDGRGQPEQELGR